MRSPGAARPSGTIWRRFELFEFTDLDRWPAAWCALLTDWIRLVVDTVQPFNPRITLIRAALRRARGSKIIDLCAGAGGPWRHLYPQLALDHRRPLSVILTDKHSHPRDSAHRPAEPVRYHPHPVDALQVPPELDGPRTLFNAFHHFSPSQAQTLLGDATRHRQPVIIFENLQRTWRDLAMVLLLPFVLLLLTPLVRPFRWSRLLFTYVLPIALVCVPWDVAVSVLRCYTTDELIELAEAAAPAYTWKAGSYRYRGTPVTYLIGWPETRG